jgi:hypothetical protein
VTNTSGVSESQHHLTTLCSTWSKWKYELVGFGSRLQGSWHWEAERTRICTTTENWTLTPYEQTCYSTPVSCLTNYTPYNGSCCRKDDFTKCYAPDTTRHGTNRTYGTPEQRFNVWAETEIETWKGNPITWPYRSDGDHVTISLRELVRLGTGGKKREGSEPVDLVQVALPPVVRGDLVNLGLLGPTGIEGVDEVELYLDGEPIAPDLPIDTSDLQPGDHLVSLEAIGSDGRIRSTLVLPVQEPVTLDFAQREVRLDYGGTTETNTVVVEAAVENLTQSEKSVTTYVLASPPGWSADIVGERSFVLAPGERRAMKVHFEVSDPIALIPAKSTFGVAARLNRSEGRSRDVVATIDVIVSAEPSSVRDAADVLAISRQPSATETMTIDAATLASLSAGASDS